MMESTGSPALAQSQSASQPQQVCGAQVSADSIEGQTFTSGEHSSLAELDVALNAESLPPVYQSPLSPPPVILPNSPVFMSPLGSPSHMLPGTFPGSPTGFYIPSPPMSPTPLMMPSSPGNMGHPLMMPSSPPGSVGNPPMMPYFPPMMMAPMVQPTESANDPTNNFTITNQTSICIASPQNCMKPQLITGFVSPKNQTFPMGLFASPLGSPASAFPQFYGFAPQGQYVMPQYQQQPQEPPQGSYQPYKDAPSMKHKFRTGANPRRLDFETERPNSKRDAVHSCLTQLDSLFGDITDENGFRGETALRIRVKTWTAITHIVPFLCKAKKVVKIKKVSFPISTKGLGRILRGFLAYVQVENIEERTKLQNLFDEYQKTNEEPFKKLEITL